MGIYDKQRDEQFTPFSELCKFADAFEFTVELEKPFSEMDNMFLKVLDSDKNEIVRVTLEDISMLNAEAADILNDLGKKN